MKVLCHTFIGLIYVQILKSAEKSIMFNYSIVTVKNTIKEKRSAKQANELNKIMMSYF